MANNSPKKLTVTAYKDPLFKKKIGAITVQMNPESYSWTHSAKADNQHDEQEESDTESRKFGQLSPQSLDFEFWLDDTGVAGSMGKIVDTIKEFKRLACDYNGETHGINYLIVAWGKFSFKCQLTQFNVNYNLFNSKGIPLRAKCKTSFKEFVDAATLNARQNRSSPDLSHVHTIQVGDTLPNICYQTYGSSKYYLQVAETNGLANFRRLTPGQKIILPPLDK